MRWGHESLVRMAKALEQQVSLGGSSPRDAHSYVPAYAAETRGTVSSALLQFRCMRRLKH